MSLPLSTCSARSSRPLEHRDAALTIAEVAR